MKTENIDQTRFYWAKGVLANSREFYEKQLESATSQDERNYAKRRLKNWDTAASEFPELAEEARAFYSWIRQQQQKHR